MRSGIALLLFLCFSPSSRLLAQHADHACAHDPQNSNTIRSNDIADTLEDAHGDLWIAHQSHGIDHVRRDVPCGQPGSVYRYGSGLRGKAFFPHNINSFWIIDDYNITLFRRPERQGGQGRPEARLESLFLIHRMLKGPDERILVETSNRVFVIVRMGNEYTLGALQPESGRAMFRYLPLRWTSWSIYCVYAALLVSIAWFLIRSYARRPTVQ